HRASADELLALLAPVTAAAGEHPRTFGFPPTDDGSIAVGRERDRHPLAQEQCWFTRSAAHQLVALLRPDAAAAREHPHCSRRPVVARTTDDGGVAVGGHGDGRTLRPQASSIIGSGADQLGLLPPAITATRNTPRRPGWPREGRPIAISIVGAGSTHDGGVAVRGQCDRHALVCASNRAGSDQLRLLLEGLRRRNLPPSTNRLSFARCACSRAPRRTALRR